MMATLRVAVADDHPMIRLGIEAVLADLPRLDCIGMASDSTSLFALLDDQACDVLITDYAMPGGSQGDGLELMQALRTRFPDMSLIVLTAMDKAVLIRRLLGLQVDAILSKADDLSHLRAAIQAVQAKRRYFSPRIAQQLEALPGGGGIPLSPRELEVIKLFLGGLSIGAIAEHTARSKQTISAQKNSAMHKLGIEQDADLFKYAAELGLLD